MTTPRYVVRFRGALLPGYTVERAESELVQRSGVGPQTARQLLSCSNVIVGRDVSAEKANAIESRLRAAGVVVEIGPSAAGGSPGFATDSVLQSKPQVTSPRPEFRGGVPSSIPVARPATSDQQSIPVRSIPLGEHPEPAVSMCSGTGVEVDRSPAVERESRPVESIPLAHVPGRGMPTLAGADDGHMECPRCKSIQVRADSCAHCGVIIAKFLAVSATAPFPAPEYSSTPDPEWAAYDTDDGVDELTLAPRGLRLAAKILDGFFVLLCMVAIVAPAVDWADKLRFLLGGGIVALVTLFCVQTVMLAVRGQTVGKIAFGIRIARAVDGSNAGFFRAVLLRSWLNAVFGAIGGAYQFVDAALILTGDRRCVHDYLAGTIVVDADDADAQPLRIISGTRFRQALMIVAILIGSVAVGAKTSLALVDALRLQSPATEVAAAGELSATEGTGDAKAGGPDYEDLFAGFVLLVLLGGAAAAGRRLRR